jgi:hypothetical protein
MSKEPSWYIAIPRAPRWYAARYDPTGLEQINSKECLDFAAVRTFVVEVRQSGTADVVRAMCLEEPTPYELNELRKLGVDVY